MTNAILREHNRMGTSRLDRRRRTPNHTTMFGLLPEKPIEEESLQDLKKPAISHLADHVVYGEHICPFDHCPQCSPPSRPLEEGWPPCGPSRRFYDAIKLANEVPEPREQEYDIDALEMIEEDVSFVRGLASRGGSISDVSLTLSDLENLSDDEMDTSDSGSCTIGSASSRGEKVEEDEDSDWAF